MPSSGKNKFEFGTLSQYIFCQCIYHYMIEVDFGNLKREKIMKQNCDLIKFVC